MELLFGLPYNYNILDKGLPCVRCSEHLQSCHRPGENQAACSELVVLYPASLFGSLVF